MSGYGPNIITDGLVLCLDVANSKSYKNTTTWYDLSDHNNNGTLVNGISKDSSNMGSLILEGTNDYIDMSNDRESLILNQGGTIEAWVKWNSYNGTNWSNTVVGKGGSGWSSHHYILFKRASTNRYLFSVSNGTSYLNGSGPETPDIVLDEWHQIVATWDNDNKSIYLNGDLEETVSSSIMPIDNKSQVSIGRTGTNGYYLDGNVSIVRMYDRALTSSEVKQNFKSNRDRFNI